MKRAGLVLLVAACHSAVINVERASSGAVEGDVDFEPVPGPDGHFISLPAYPLVNCTDTLVYDKLLDDFLTAASHAGAMPEAVRLRRYEDDRLRPVKDPEQAQVIARRLRDTDQFLTTLMGTQLARIARAARRDAVMRPVVALARRGSDLAKLQPLAHGSKSFACIKAGAVTFASDADIDNSLVHDEGFTAKTTALRAERERVKHAFEVAVADALAAVAAAGNPHGIPLVRTLALLPANSPTCVPIRAEVVDAVVSFAKQTADDLDLLRSVAPRDVFSDGELQGLIPAGDLGREPLLEAARDFVRLADSFGTTACASGPRYRDFLGYAGSNSASWIDRTQPQQEQQLNALESELGVTPTAGWPRAEFAFLHFSDVQIREPGAKFGGTEISGTLRQLESSFEQDYYQGQYAMFVYQAIVTTANQEWCLYHQDDPACGPSRAPARPDDTRPPPAMMIHTGDSADMGLQSEFDTFLTYTDKLHVPWYQVLGNHDVLAFGNLKLISKNAPHAPDDECQGWGLTPCTCTSLDTLVREEVRRTPDNHGATPDAMPRPWFTPLPSVLSRICILHEVASDWFVMDPDKQRGGNAVNSFVLSHCGGWRPKPGDGSPPPKECTRLPQQVAVAPSYAHKPTAAGRCAMLHGEGPETSVMHGLDLMPDFRLDIDRQSRDLGYYCFQMMRGTVSNGGRVFAVALNTNTDAGAFGVLSHAQLSWLRELLPTKESCAAAAATPGAGDPDNPQIGCKDLVLLFAHHPIYSIYDQHQRLELTDLVTTRPNVVGMFIGHKHRSGLRMVRPLPGSDGHAKWEVMGPAVIDWPQAAREVILKTHGELGYFEVLTFTPRGTGASVPKIRAAQDGAVRDKCRNEPDNCPDGDGRIRQPTRDLTFPRLFFRLPR